MQENNSETVTDGRIDGDADGRRPGRRDIAISSYVPSEDARIEIDANTRTLQCIKEIHLQNFSSICQRMHAKVWQSPFKALEIAKIDLCNKITNFLKVIFAKNFKLILFPQCSVSFTF